MELREVGEVPVEGLGEAEELVMAEIEEAEEGNCYVLHLQYLRRPFAGYNSTLIDNRNDWIFWHSVHKGMSCHRLARGRIDRHVLARHLPTSPHPLLCFVMIEPVQTYTGATSRR